MAWASLRGVIFVARKYSFIQHIIVKNNYHINESAQFTPS
nr:MAG TPA: hypothetical protein [Caudoviricetes sp.]